MKKIKIGIVGYGKVATRTHARWIEESKDAELVAVCDSTEVRREAAKQDNPDLRIYGDYEAFLSDDDIDLVIVTTPPNSHCELSVHASRAGKHVFVDKPFSMNLVETKKMLEAADESGCVIHCHQSRRYDAEYTRISDLVSSGKIGEIRHIRRIWSQYGEGWTNWGIDGFNPTWRIQREYGGGMVYDYAPHCGDQILRLVDKPLHHVFADVRSIRFSKEVDDHFSCLLRFDGGITAYLEATNLAQLSGPHWYVMGTEGCITADTVNGTVFLKRDDLSEPAKYEPIDRKQDLYENVLASCRGDAEPNVTAGQLQASSALIDAIFASAANGEVVTI